MKRVVVGKAWQGAALAAMTLLILCVTLLLDGGRRVGTNLAPFEDLARILHKAQRGQLLSVLFTSGAVGIALNLFLFVPWGFVAWKFLDGVDRGALRTHAEVIFFGLVLSAGIEFVQLFLPTRAADIDDVIWNVFGAAAGGILAHLGREMRIEWG